MSQLLDRIRLTMGAMPLLAWAIWIVVVLTTFLGPLDISSDAAKMTVGLDGQVACKLLVSGLAFALGLFGFLTSSSVRQTASTLPPMMLLGILALAGLATPIAISGTSLPTTLINIGYLFFAITALLTLGLRGVATAILIGITITMLTAMSFYLFVPKYGIFPELLARGQIVYRLSGTAHPNAVGRAMMIGLILTLYLLRSRVIPINIAAIATFCFATAAYLAWSRTAIVAGLFGLAILYLDRLFSRAGLIAMSCVVMLGLFSLTTMFVSGQEDHVIGRILSKVSKTGDAEEITSGTGRADIWARATELISSRPVIGHGFSAAPTLMSNHSQATHNAVLHATLAAGIGGGALMLGMLLWNLFLVFSCDSLLVRALSAFIVLSCLTEDTVLETFPGPCSLVWLLCSFYPILIRQPSLHTDLQTESVALSTSSELA